MRFLILLTVCAFLFGFLIGGESVSAMTTKQWRTVEKISGYSPSDNPFPKTSDEGRFVVFHSHIANLVPNDSNNLCDTDGNSVKDNSCADIFAYDRETKNIKLISVSTNGTQGNQRSAFPSISSDARYIAFSSQASNLVPDGTHNCPYVYPPFLQQCTDIFVHDMDNEITDRVSVASDGTKANGNSNFPSISADGRYITFSSEASNLIPNGVHICRDSFSSHQCYDIFVHDRLTETTELTSVASNGEKGNQGSYQPSISADGRHVVFLSSASNLVSNDNNGRSDVFIRHLDTEETEIVSIASDGTQSNLDAEFGMSAVSEDGRYVAFVSRSTNLVANDSNDATDVFVRDLQTGITVRASVATDGSQTNDRSGSYKPSISSDGRYILFDSWATNLVANDTNDRPDIFVRDLQTGTTTRVSLAQDGSQANLSSSGGSISPDGKFASFNSAASNLLPGDLNNAPDIFVAEASTATTFLYLSQKDPAWGGQVYDHADSIGSFFCGTTIAGCGCAITSSAMLLKYYGVDKSPAGDPTNPQTLNNWLKANNGYAFGALKWNSIAAYSIKANQAWQTQKIKFSGIAPANNFSALDAELANNQPTILQEPGHFIVASKKQGSDYSIADPAWENKTTLAAYSNSFQSMRRFEKTTTDLSAIQISAPAPTEIFVTDSKGKRTGKDPQTGQIYNEIPDSYYTIEPAYSDQNQGNPQLPDPSNGVTTLVILTPRAQTFNSHIFGSPEYSIDFSAYDMDGNTNVQQFENIPNGGIQNFEINYSPTDITQLTVTQIVDIDIKPGSNPNSINLKSNGLIPVAILTSEDFDATTIDPQSIKFGPNEIGEAHQTGHLEDTDADGDIDMVLHFKTQKTGILAGDVEVCLEGMTFTGIPFLGCDTVRIVGNSP